MVRFYKTYLGRLLLGLLVLIEVERQQGKAGVTTLVQQFHPVDVLQEDAVNRAVNYYLNGYPDETPSNDEVLLGVFGQMTKKKTDDSDLLDTIVGILRLPYLGGFSASAVKLLRDAILTPAELSELRKTTKSVSKCSCGHEFNSSEMVSVHVSGDTLSLICTKCDRPSYIRCDYCDQLVSMNRVNWKNPVDCGCQKKAKAEQQTTTATLGNHLRTGGAGIILDETAAISPAQMRILRRGVYRSQGATAAMPTQAPPPQPTQQWNVLPTFIGQPGDGNVTFTLPPPPDQLLDLDDE